MNYSIPLPRPSVVRPPPPPPLNPIEFPKNLNYHPFVHMHCVYIIRRPPLAGGEKACEYALRALERQGARGFGIQEAKGHLHAFHTPTLVPGGSPWSVPFCTCALLDFVHMHCEPPVPLIVDAANHFKTIDPFCLRKKKKKGSYQGLLGALLGLFWRGLGALLGLLKLSCEGRRGWVVGGLAPQWGGASPLAAGLSPAKPCNTLPSPAKPSRGDGDGDGDGRDQG